MAQATTSRWADNTRRLFGMHALTAEQAASALGFGARQTVAEWISGRRQPSLQALMEIERVFEVSGPRMLDTPFSDLLEHELGSAERFEAVEKKLKPHRKVGTRRLALTPMKDGPKPISERAVR